MKRNFTTGLFIVMIGAALLSALPAHATNYPAPQQPSGIGLGLALSGSLSASEGGDADAAAKAKADAKVGDITVAPGGTQSKDTTYVLPAPVGTLVPQAMGDCTKTDSWAAAGLWNGISGSSSKQSAELFCAGLRLSERYEAACQYLSADMIRNRVAAFLFPGSGDLPAQPGLQNLTTEQCNARRSAK